MLKSSDILKYIHPSKMETTSTRRYYRFQIANHVTTTYLFKGIYAKTTDDITSFILECSQDPLIQNRADF